MYNLVIAHSSAIDHFGSHCVSATKRGAAHKRYPRKSVCVPQRVNWLVIVRSRRIKENIGSEDERVALGRILQEEVAERKKMKGLCTRKGFLRMIDASS
jgi:hypothetical protein